MNAVDAATAFVMYGKKNTVCQNPFAHFLCNLAITDEIVNEIAITKGKTANP
ncbi:Uncharacterised protein [Mycoplasmopsis edwardii]|uniref:Uncharacterized protein n=1 Tax=Mycoplasmopsis edwardii TaxID=53558 RepID=A0A3B0PMP0_9BACT|nr:Uncharacterised protein [Mycoplasmopsis edwardii]